MFICSGAARLVWPLGRIHLTPLVGRGNKKRSEQNMTPDQVKLVQQSFTKVAPISEQAAVLFYDRLFEVAPSVRALFPDDMTEQRKKLMATLAVVVGGLGNLDSI